LISAVAGAVSPSALWYLARGSGLVLLGLLTANLVLGIAIQGGWHPSRWPRFVAQGVHRNLALLAMVLLVIHVVTIELDPFVGVGWWAVFVPFVSPYRPIWLALGTLSLDILAAVVATSLLRRHLRPNWWRLIHWLGYLAWPLALLHSIGTGTDSHVGAAFVYEIACLGLVAAVVLIRLARTTWPGQLRRAALVLAVAAMPVAVIVWAASGPLQPGWAQRAGTPTSVLASASGAGTAPPSSAGSTTVLAPFTASFAGTLTSTQGAGSETLIIQGQALGGGGGTLRVVLQGQPVATGGVELSGGSAVYQPATARATFQGQIVGLEGSVVVVDMRAQGSSPVRVTLSLAGQPGSTQVSGQFYFGTAVPGAGEG